MGGESLFAALRFYGREISSMRRFRLTHSRPSHLTPTKWRLLEYRFTWALAKQVVRRRG